MLANAGIQKRPNYLGSRLRGNDDIMANQSLPSIQGGANTWPGGRQVAVVFQLIFEQWAGTHVEPGRHPAPQLPATALRSGVRDLLSLSWQEYAGRAGFYRLMDVAHAQGVVATGLFSGLAAQKYPDIAREFAERGNELVAHAWAEDVRSCRLGDDELRAEVRRTRQIITETSGYEPVGWSSAGHFPGGNSVGIVAEEGFTYLIETVDDDRPVVIEAANRKLVAFAPSFDLNDQLTYARGRNPPSSYVDMFTRALDAMLAERTDGPPRLLTAVLHATLYGHPMGGWALRECIRYAQDMPDVWITTNRACAEFWLENFS